MVLFKQEEKEQTFSHQAHATQEHYKHILGRKFPEIQPASPNINADCYGVPIQTRTAWSLA